MTVRPMFGGQILRERHSMEEPTIDCYCSAHAQVELQLQVLTDDARWTIYHRAARCLEHLPLLLECSIESLEEHARIVLMPL